MVEEVIEPQEETQTIYDLSLESYEKLFSKFETEMPFKGKSIDEWSSELTIQEITPDMSFAEVEAYTVRISNITDIIVTNYSLASAHFNGLKRSVERAVMLSKTSILNDIEMSGKKKISNDQLEALAYERTSKMHVDSAISEMFYHFWKIQYDKIYLLNQRVTSLNVLKNIESKGYQLT